MKAPRWVGGHARYGRCSHDISEKNSWKKMAVISFATAVAAVTFPALAVDKGTIYGTTGADGSNGTVTQVVNPDGTVSIIVSPGGAGGDGGAATNGAIANDPANNAAAVGGNGGKGGNGTAGGVPIHPSAGGNGGAGGNATAFSEQLNFTGSAPNGMTDTAIATGGNGGAGGNGGSARFAGTGAGGNGGVGGSSYADSIGNASVGLNYLESEAVSTGGNGGDGGTVNGAGGDGGPASVLASTDDAVAAGNQFDYAFAIGGNGGHGNGTGAGGNGANENLTSAVSANNSTYGMYFKVGAVGGNSGGSNGGNAGLAGNANASFNIASANVAVQAKMSAVGGAGGDCQNTSGSVGGDASASVNLSSSSDVSATAIANGGLEILLDTNPSFDEIFTTNSKGSDITAGTGTAGDGGIATASAVAHSTGTASNANAASADAEAYGGYGGDVLNSATGNGGHGGTASVDADVQAADTETDPFVTNFGSGYSVGGNGGQGSGTGFSGGDGGVASIVAVSGADANGAGLQNNAWVIGGGGGAGINSANGGKGASESLTNAVSGSTTGYLGLNQEAEGGSGGMSDSAAGGSGGDAYSSLSFNQNDVADLTLGSYANAGNGGDGQIAGAGGNSTSSVNATTGAGITAYVQANVENINTSLSLNKGNGGSITGGTSGTGGAGGTANTSAILNSTANGCGLYMYAVGGDGGNVGGGAVGNGGAGGAATASATGTGAGVIELNVSAAGGNGGDGEGTGYHGADGAIPSLGTINATSTGGGNVSIGIQLIGGNGGSGNNGANGGNGAGVTLNNAFTLSTTGSIWFTQTAIGGSAGGASGNNAGLPGAAGDASSTMNYTVGPNSPINGTAIADAGSGGDTQNMNGGKGGDATATITITGHDNVTATASTNFDSNGLDYIPSHGPNVLFAGSLGGNGFTGGIGGNAMSSAIAIGDSTSAGHSAVTSLAYAYGPSGGYSYWGNGGSGGPASASASATGAGPDTVKAYAIASGGTGGNIYNGFMSGDSNFVTGNGGGATALSEATSPTNPAIANADAFGGAPGGANYGVSYSGVEGQASTAASGHSSGLFATIQATALSGAGSTSQAHSEAQLNDATSAPAFSSFTSFRDGSPLEAASAIVAPALSSDVTSRWTGMNNIQARLANDPSNADAIMVARMQTPSATSGPQVYSTSFDVNEANALVAGNGVVIGMLPPQITGSGLQAGDTLRFRIQRDGVTLYDQTFASNSSVTAELQNSVFQLGRGNADLGSNNLDLKFLFDLTSSHASSGIDLQFLLGHLEAVQEIPGGNWNSFAGGSWALPTDWVSNTIPIGPGSMANFGSAITSPSTITLDESTTIGSITFDNNNAYTIAKGSGNYSLILDNAGADPLINVTNGRHEIAADVQLGSATDISITANSAMKFSDDLTGKVHSLQLAGSTDNWSAQLDLVNNDLIVTDDVFSNLVNQIKQGYDKGAWDGNGIIASAAASTPGTALGIELNSNGHGGAWFTSFDGQTVSANDTLIKFTWIGDANLDGIVDANDLALMSSSGKTWRDGDFNYDGVVNADDYSLYMFGAAASGGMNISTILPEPTAIILLVAPVLIRRRRNLS